jgi:hypothetical protein
MPESRSGLKMAVMLLSLAILCVGYGSTSSAQRSKKDNMVEMGQAYRAMHAKVLAGAVDNKFTDQDFQEISTQCGALARLADEYAKLESNQDLAKITLNLVQTVQSLTAQADRKDPLILVMIFGRAISYCAECHYQTRWSASPSK